MESIVRELTTFQPDRGVTLTIGVFDGVHRGHHYLLQQVVERARAAGRVSAAITFHPHPRLVLQPDLKAAYLTSIEDRFALIRDLGIDRVATITFTRALSQLSPTEFLDLVQAHLRLEDLIVGHDFALGKNRQGNSATLRELGQTRGFTVTEVDPFLLDGVAVSSTLIRRAIAAGDMPTASRYLGRPFSIEGEVISGDQRGRQLGFPTANLAIPTDSIVPATGIYVTKTIVGDRTYGSVTNMGFRPTVNNRGYLIETNLFDFTGDLYGQRIRVELLERLRDEKKFSGLAELTEQIGRDAEMARQYLRR